MTTEPQLSGPGVSPRHRFFRSPVDRRHLPHMLRLPRVLARADAEADPAADPAVDPAAGAREADSRRDRTVASTILFATHQPDHRVGEFRLIRRLGRGGMGTVHLAYAEHLGRYVAVKLIDAGRCRGEVARRLELERRLLAALRHPNIAQFLGGGQAPDGSPYIAMELILGETLDAYCRSHELSVEKRLRLVCTVCEAVQYAHRNLIVHQDLKPDNVLVTHAGVPKLVDFGIAMVNPLASAAGGWADGDAAMMTPEYASPEQVCGEPVTTATDIYSLGVMLSQLLSGQRPDTMSGLSRTAMARTICRRPPPRPSVHVGRLSRDLDEIVAKAMAETPTDRYASAQELAHDLRRFMAGEAIVARPPTLAGRVARLLRRRGFIRRRSTR